MNNRFMKIVSAVSALALAAMACSVFTPSGVNTGGDSNTNTTVDVPTESSNSNANTNGGGFTGGGSGSGNDNGNGNINGNGNDVSGKRLFSDNFEGRSSNWSVGDDTDYTVQYVNGALQFNVFATNMEVYSSPNDTTYKNIHIEADATSTGTDPKAAFGLICNQGIISDAFYFAYITPSGGYGIVKAIFIDDDVELASGTSDLIPRNAGSYRIGFDCNNGTLTLYVNGQKIDSATDSEYTDGTVGAIAWSGDVSSGTTVTFDNYLVTSLP